jgi:NAD(P)-dependent dehydrogenase (short-subunit alcohol dehydrogenase family)
MKGPVVVLDAAVGIGRAVAQAVVDAGRPLIAVSGDPASLKRLKAEFRGVDLTLVRGSVADDRSSAELAAALRNLDRPLAGIVVAIHREPDRGRVLEQATDVLRQGVIEEVLPQLAAAHALLPLLAEAGRNGRYVVIGGPGSEHPWAGYGHRSISAAATRMLLRVLHDEARALAVRVQLLAVDMPARTADNSKHACGQWPDAIDIGERALALIDQSDPREPAEAVVRYAWNVVPSLRKAVDFRAPRSTNKQQMHDQRASHARKTPRSKSSASSRNPTSSDSVPNDASPLPNLDDTWALLKPLLFSNH